jgi:ribose 5-phosphate isomerase A
MAQPISADDLKRRAAERALDEVQSGMTLGLGTGSTAAHLVKLLGAKVAKGFDVRCVPTSEVTATLARSFNIPLTTLDDVTHLDLTIDGTDEVDGELRLIKGAGGALLREKIVAAASDRMVVIADASKRVQTLGAFPLSVEVVHFGLGATCETIKELAEEVGCAGPVRVRMASDGKPFVTDTGNLILDCHFGRIDDPDGLDAILKLIPGVVENGLFLGLASRAILAGPDGIEIIDAPDDEL